MDTKEPNSFQSADECHDQDTSDQILDKDKIRGETLENDYDPADLLNHWLEELDMSKMVSRASFGSTNEAKIENDN